MKKKFIVALALAMTMICSVALAGQWFCREHNMWHDGSRTYFCKKHNVWHKADGKFFCREHNVWHDGFGCCHR